MSKRKQKKIEKQRKRRANSGKMISVEIPLDTFIALETLTENELADYFAKKAAAKGITAPAEDIRDSAKLLRCLHKKQVAAALAWARERGEKVDDLESQMPDSEPHHWAAGGTG